MAVRAFWSISTGARQRAGTSASDVLKTKCHEMNGLCFLVAASGVRAGWVRIVLVTSGTPSAACFLLLLLIVRQERVIICIE